MLIGDTEVHMPAQALTVVALLLLLAALDFSTTRAFGRRSV